MQHHAADRTKSFTRRALVVGGMQTSLFGLLAGRLWQLQVDQSPQYSLLAEENRVSQRLTVPPRGRILDRNGEFWRATGRAIGSGSFARTPAASTRRSMPWPA